MFSFCSIHRYPKLSIGRGRRDPWRSLFAGLARHCPLRLGEARGYEDGPRVPSERGAGHADAGVDARRGLSARSAGEPFEVSTVRLATSEACVYRSSGIEPRTISRLRVRLRVRKFSWYRSAPLTVLFGLLRFRPWHHPASRWRASQDSSPPCLIRPCW